MWVGRERFRACLQFFGRAAHHGNIHFVGLQHAHQLLAVAHGQTNVYTGVLAAKVGQHAHHEVLGRADHADGQHPGLGPLQACSRVFGVLDGGQNFAGINQHVFARGRQAHLLAGALEQGHTHMALKLLDLHGHGWWRQVQAFGGAHKTEVAGDLVEHPQLAESGVFHSAIN